MRLPDQETDKLVRDYVVAELMQLQRTIDSWADAENQKADELEKITYHRDHFAIARHRERAAAGHTFEKLIDVRRRKLEGKYDSHQLANELVMKCGSGDSIPLKDHPLPGSGE